MIKWAKRVSQKFVNAFRGFYIVLKEEKSLWVHLFTTIVVIIFGVVFNLNLIEWSLIVFAIGLVIGFELLNTAIEYLVDIVSFEYSVKAKKVKDVAATATLVATLTAVAIGLLVFIPAIINFSAGAEPASNAISFMIGNIYV